MSGWGSFSFAFGPLFALFGVLVLVWMLKRSGFASRPAPDDDDVRAPVIGPLPWADVHRIVRQLREAGLDPTISDQGDGYRVLVPADDLAQARRVIWSDLFPGT
jgi:hypothetical protein